MTLEQQAAAARKEAAHQLELADFYTECEAMGISEEDAANLSSLVGQYDSAQEIIEEFLEFCNALD